MLATCKVLTVVVTSPDSYRNCAPSTLQRILCLFKCRDIGHKSSSAAPTTAASERLSCREIHHAIAPTNTAPDNKYPATMNRIVGRIFSSTISPLSTCGTLSGMYHYDPQTALEELQEEAVLPHPVHLRDMILRAKLNPEQALDLNCRFQSYLHSFGEIQTLVRALLEDLSRADRK